MPDPKKKSASLDDKSNAVSKRMTPPDTIKASIQKTFPKANVSKMKNTINKYSVRDDVGSFTMSRSKAPKKKYFGED